MGPIRPHLEKAMKRMVSLAALPLKTAVEYSRNWNKNGVGVQAIRSFVKDKRRFRHYIDLKRPTSMVVPIPDNVRAAVEAAGYKIEDYRAGLASTKDGKRVMKIGKILSALKDEKLLAEFVNDKNRQGRGYYTVVISAHPYDVIGMSTGRDWDMVSCMRLGDGADYSRTNDGTTGSRAEYIKNDVAEGTLVAYVVQNIDLLQDEIATLEKEWMRGPIQKEKMELLDKLKRRLRDAKNVRAPKARLLIKPFYNAEGDIYWKVERKVYGEAIPGFTAAVEEWLKEVNANAKRGVYKLARGLYNDGIGADTFVGNPDDDAEVAAFLKSARFESLPAAYAEHGIEFREKAIANLSVFALSSPNGVIHDTFRHEHKETGESMLLSGSEIDRVLKAYANRITQMPNESFVQMKDRAYIATRVLAAFMKDYNQNHPECRKILRSMHGVFAYNKGNRELFEHIVVDAPDIVTSRTFGEYDPIWIDEYEQLTGEKYLQDGGTSLPDAQQHFAGLYLMGYFIHVSPEIVNVGADSSVKTVSLYYRCVESLKRIWSGHDDARPIYVTTEELFDGLPPFMARIKFTKIVDMVTYFTGMGKSSLLESWIKMDTGIFKRKFRQIVQLETAPMRVLLLNSFTDSIVEKTLPLGESTVETIDGYIATLESKLDQPADAVELSDNDTARIEEILNALEHYEQYETWRNQLRDLIY